MLICLGTRCVLYAYSVPSHTILADNLIFVANPVSVPSPERGRVVHTDRVNTLDFESSTLELIDDKAERSGSVSARKDVLVHEQTPDKILVLPGLAKASNLQEKDTIVVQHVVDLGKETAKVADTDVLSHLKASDLVVAAFWDRDVTIVHAEDAGLLFGDAKLAHTIVAPCCLVTTKSDTSDVGAVVCRCKFGESTPATANIEHLLALLESDFLAHETKLVILQLFEALLLVGVGNDARSVDHARTQEPAVEVIATIIVVSDLLLVLRTSVHDHLGHHASQEEPEQAQGEAEVGPVVSVFHDLQTIAIEVYLFVKVHLMERLHGNFVLATILSLILLALEGEVLLDRSARQLGLFVETRRHGGGDRPEGHEDGDSG